MNKRIIVILISLFLIFQLAASEDSFLRRLLSDPVFRSSYEDSSLNFQKSGDAAYLSSLTSFLFEAPNVKASSNASAETTSTASEAVQSLEEVVMVSEEAVTTLIKVVENASEEGRLEDIIEVLEKLEDEIPEDLTNASIEIRNQALSIRMSLAVAYGLSGNLREAAKYEEALQEERRRLPPLAVALFAEYGINLTSSNEEDVKRTLENVSIAEAKKYGLGIFEFIHSTEDAKHWIEMALDEREWDFASLLINESLKRSIVLQSYWDEKAPLVVAGLYSNTLLAAMISVSAGGFTMGNDQGSANVKPAHSVTLTKNFAVSPYQVTFEIFDLYCVLNGVELPSDQGWGRGGRPAINVSWMEALKFSNWLSELQGLSPVYLIDGDNISWVDGADGFRLPTEAEWEYAARGGNMNDSSGYAGSSEVADIAWYKDNSQGMTQEVGQKSPNLAGLYDMNGNIWEWCWDSFQANYYESSPGEDPRGPDSAPLKVVRGGSYNDSKPYLLTSFRFYFQPQKGDRRLGFRLYKFL